MHNVRESQNIGPGVPRLMVELIPCDAGDSPESDIRRLPISVTDRPIDAYVKRGLEEVGVVLCFVLARTSSFKVSLRDANPILVPIGGYLVLPLNVIQVDREFVVRIHVIRILDRRLLGLRLVVLTTGIPELRFLGRHVAACESH